MNDMGKSFLPYAALTRDQYGKVGIGYLHRYLECVVEGGGIANDAKAVLDTLCVHPEKVIQVHLIGWPGCSCAPSPKHNLRVCVLFLPLGKRSLCSGCC